MTRPTSTHNPSSHLRADRRDTAVCVTTMRVAANMPPAAACPEGNE
jgi:hypothetical protein